MESLIRILMQRDGLDRAEAVELVQEAKERVRQGEDPEELLHDEFGLGPDYIWEILTGM